MSPFLKASGEWGSIPNEPRQLFLHFEKDISKQTTSNKFCLGTFPKWTPSGGWKIGGEHILAMSPWVFFGTSRGLLSISEASLPSAKLFHLMKVEQNVKTKENITAYGILGLS